MSATENRQSRPTKTYDAIMLFLSAYVLGQLAIEVILDLPPAVSQMLYWIDFGICMVFLADWVWFFVKADDKGRYFKTRLIDLISSIPFSQALRPLRVFRMVRLVRTLRIIRGLKGAFPLMRVAFANPSRSAMTIYGSLTLVIYFYCSVGLYNFEKGLNDSIVNFGDVLWMSFTTLTSVGYGDIYPVTSGGRILAAVLVVTGMGLFSLVTAEIATLILRLVRSQGAE
jgi:voltage-gated potassium channel